MKRYNVTLSEPKDKKLIDLIEKMTGDGSKHGDVIKQLLYAFLPPHFALPDEISIIASFHTQNVQETASFHTQNVQEGQNPQIVNSEVSTGFEPKQNQNDSVLETESQSEDDLQSSWDAL